MTLLEFPGGLVVKGYSVVTAVVWVRPLAWELLHAMGAAKKKKKNITGAHNAGYSEPHRSQ